MNGHFAPSSTWWAAVATAILVGGAVPAASQDLGRPAAPRVHSPGTGEVPRVVPGEQPPAAASSAIRIPDVIEPPESDKPRVPGDDPAQDRMPGGTQSPSGIARDRPGIERPKLPGE